MKPVDVTSGIYIKYDVDNNGKDRKNNFGNGYTPNWSNKVFVISKVKNTVPWTYVISDLNDEEVVGTFYEKKRCKREAKKSDD